MASAAANDEKALDTSARKGSIVEPRLNVRNTLIKTALDQSIGAVVNTLLFGGFMTSISLAMSHRPAKPSHSAAFIFSGRAVDFSRVDAAAVWQKTRAEFWPVITAGWRFWPFVSLVNFAFVKTVEMRNLVGSLAGIAWGVYISLFTAK